MELCLFAEDGRTLTRSIPIRESTGRVWHCYVPGLRPGQLYGFRVHGPYEPENGYRFNPAKLLIDPYAKALAGTVDWNQPVFGYPLGNPNEDLEKDDRDSAAGVPKGVVTTPHFDWENDRPPLTPWHDSIIYELHVKGFSARNPGIPAVLSKTPLCQMQ